MQRRPIIQADRQERRGIKRDVSTRGTLIHISRQLLKDMTCLVIGRENHDLDVQHRQEIGQNGAPDQECFTVDLGSEDEALKFNENIREVNKASVKQSLGGRSIRLRRDEGRLELYVNDISDVAVLVEHIVNAQYCAPMDWKPINTIDDLANPSVTNLRLMSAQYGLPETHLVEAYNKVVGHLGSRRYQGFSYSPDDLRRAINTDNKVRHDIAEIPSTFLLYMH